MNSMMTKAEREDLQRLIRQREKVLKSAAKQRSSELLAADHHRPVCAHVVHAVLLRDVARRRRADDALDSPEDVPRDLAGGKGERRQPRETQERKSERKQQPAPQH
jgi:hypothetical protein